MNCSAMLSLAIICHASRENVRRILSSAATFAFIKSKVGRAISERDEHHDWPARIRHAFQVDAEPNLFLFPVDDDKSEIEP